MAIKTKDLRAMVEPVIHEAAKQMAQKDGKGLSEWLRDLVQSEAVKRGILEPPRPARLVKA